MDKLRATIVVTTHDRHELADRAVASALAQTVTGTEVIVVDDGSDPPYELPGDDPRLRLIRNERPLGPSAARNRAIEAASGEWITFLDDDDTLSPRMLEVSLDAAERSSLPPPVSVISAAELVDVEGRVLTTRRPPSLPVGSHYFLEDDGGEESFETHATLVAPIDVVNEIGRWDEDLPASEHDDFFLRLNAASSIQGVDTVTYRITVHGGPRLSKAVLPRAIGMERTLKKHRATFRQHPARYAHYVGAMGVAYLRSGRWWRAVVATTHSLTIDPRPFRSYVWWLAALCGPWPVALRRRLRARRQRQPITGRVA